MRLASDQQRSEPTSVVLSDDGELQEYVFCLHCHSANPSGLEVCASCKQPLIEAPADLRDRLERISAYNDHPSGERRVDQFFQTYEDLADGAFSRAESASRRILQAFVSIPLTSVKNYFAQIYSDLDFIFGMVFERRVLAAIIVVIQLIFLCVILGQFVVTHLR